MTEIEKLGKQVIELRDALEAARDHLEYCGYGDAWERECAEARDLSGKIERALESSK